MGVRKFRSSEMRQLEQIAHAIEVLGKPLKSTHKVNKACTVRRTDERRLRCNVRMIERDGRVHKARERESAQLNPLEPGARTQIRIAASPRRNQTVEGVPHKGKCSPSRGIRRDHTRHRKHLPQPRKIKMLQIVHSPCDGPQILARCAAIKALTILDAIVTVHPKRALDTRATALWNMDKDRSVLARNGHAASVTGA